MEEWRFSHMTTIVDLPYITLPLPLTIGLRHLQLLHCGLLQLLQHGLETMGKAISMHNLPKTLLKKIIKSVTLLYTCANNCLP